MGRMSRNKGARGEREIIELLQPVVTEAYAAQGYPDDWVPVLKRNTMQADGGGFDIHGLEWCALEVKRAETLCLPAWWRQTLRQAGQTKHPVLAYRKSHQPWRFRLPIESGFYDVNGVYRARGFSPNVVKDPTIAEISEDVFATYVLGRIKATLVPFRRSR